MTLNEKLCALQNEYIIGKGKHNDFANFNYRNIEDMLTALKPLLKKYNLYLTFNEEITAVLDRIYVVSVAVLHDAETAEAISSTAYAREPIAKKGMDDSQITGSTTSYARKSALAGLLAVDSGDRDPDSEDNSDKINMPETGTNGLTVLKMLDDLEFASPGIVGKLCKKQGVQDATGLPLEYIEKAWNFYVKAKTEATKA